MSDNTNERMLKGARDAAEHQVNNAIDQFAGKIPSGENYKLQAKDATNNILDNLQREGENRINGMIGPQGIFNKV